MIKITRLTFLLMVFTTWTANAENAQQRIEELEARIENLESQEISSAAKTVVIARQLNVTFANTTETRSQIEQQRAYADRVEEILEEYIDIKGYFRAGYGRNDEGGGQVGYKAPGAMSKYRLGNEAENFAEVIFGKKFFLPDEFQLDDQMKPAGKASGPVAYLQFRMDFFNPYSDFSSGSNTNVGLPEAWASFGNIISAMPEAKVWAGNRFYRRHDIGVVDFFFWNMSGGGAGIEDIPLGEGKLALAWIGTGSTSGFTDIPQPDPENEAGFSKTNFDFRYYGIPMLGGEVELGLIYSRAKTGLDSQGNDAQDTSGFSINVVHTKTNFISDDGVNKFTVQYGTESAKTFTSGFETISLPEGTFIQPDLDGSWRFRITENFTANISEHFSLGPVLLYQQTEYGGVFGKQTWYSAGARPIYHFNERMSIAVEGGVDYVDDELTDVSGNLFKLTIAPQISLGSRFNSRPAIRAFVTWASWSDDFTGMVGGNDYMSKSDGLSAGVQMEAWW